MKNMKKILALLVAVMILAVSMSVAFADDPTGSITITDSADNTVSATGKTFTAYKLLDATIAGDAIAYTIPSTPATLVNKLATEFSVTKGDNESQIAFEQRIIAAIDAAGKDNGNESATKAEALAKKLLAIAEDQQLTPIAITGGTPKTGLSLGYYVIKDSTSTGDNIKPVAAVALATVKDVEIKVKASKPELDKKIDEGTVAGRYDESDLVYDSHKIGDTVPYVIRTTIPDMTGYTKYYYIVKDTLSKGLAFDGTVTVKRIGPAAQGATDDPATTDVDESKETVTVLNNGTDYSFTPAQASTGESATEIEIVFKDFYNKEKDHAGEKIEITYSATVTKDAIIGVEGNPNTAALYYSNNPNENVDGDNDKPTNINVIGKTPDKTTRTYVTGLKIVKVDPQKNRLSGATFELSGDLNKVEILTEDKFEVSATGTYFLLKDGSYTDTDPTTLDKSAQNYAEEIAKYVHPDGKTKYTKKTSVTYSEVAASGNPLKVSATTNANGIIVFDGLASGTFTLTETNPPTGFNKLTTPINFKIRWTKPNATDGSGNCTWEAYDVTTGYNVTYDAIANEFRICIENQSGTQLPSTGGMGTTLLYVGGSILVILAAVLLITKRRMSAND